MGLEDAYREHRTGLVRLAFLLSGSREASEDAVQAAFASAHARWDDIEQPLAYLRRAVVNQVKDAQRRHFRLAGLFATRLDHVVLPPEIDETRTALARLPWPQRAVVALHYYQDLPLVEVAAVLGRPAATVRSDHRRALATLRKALS